MYSASPDSRNWGDDRHHLIFLFIIRNLIHIILIILLFAAPASCEAESIIIEDAANIGAVDVTLAYDESYSLQICWQYYRVTAHIAWQQSLPML